MSKPRASVFEEADGLDLSAFAPKTIPDADAPAPEKVRAVAEAANFPSREPRSVKPAAPPKHSLRRYRTGRNVQLNLKASQETVNAFYAVADKNGWVLGETFERAVHALERELGRTAKKPAM